MIIALTISNKHLAFKLIEPTIFVSVISDKWQEMKMFIIYLKSHLIHTHFINIYVRLFQIILCIIII